MIIIPSLATAQQYQLKNDMVRSGRVRYFPNGKRNVIIDTDSAKQLLLDPDQVLWFEKGRFRFEPVSNFTVHVKRGESLHVTHDFAIVQDTGAVCLLVHDLLISPELSSRSYLLRRRGEKKLIVIHDNSNEFDDGNFSSHDQKLLLKVFSNNPNLRQLLRQQNLTCRNLPEYVRHYNRQVNSVR
ncbi:hypothetical protein [Hymenobacter perfusus]|uniref:Uncharacterized protein n=1 Tax=Hymenobacter perfusus TaxID=1236770 RepID=A0A428KCL3_9BACT|nr:hypothetical protein [Hymenobacter perfusus]RSK44159.1 hypothetical protein EI293_06355 [Hymenobacter perfusus]